MTKYLLGQVRIPFIVFVTERKFTRMDTTCCPNNTLRIPMPATTRTDSPLRPFVSFAQKIGGSVATLHVKLGRKTTIIPGLNDRAIVRLARGEHHEDVMRWNALAHQFGGTRIRQ